MKIKIAYIIAAIFLINIAESKELPVKQVSATEISAKEFMSPPLHFTQANVSDMVRFLNATWHHYGGEPDLNKIRVEKGTRIPNPIFTIKIDEGSFFEKLNAVAKKAGLRADYRANEVVLTNLEDKEIISEEQKEKLFRKVKNRKYIWGFGEQIYSEDFRLHRSGTIKGYFHENEQYWEINDYGQLVVLNASKKVQWVFTRQADKKGQLFFKEPAGRYLLEH